MYDMICESLNNNMWIIETTISENVENVFCVLPKKKYIYISFKPYQLTIYYWDLWKPPNIIIYVILIRIK